MISAGEPYLHDVIIADRACLIEATVAAANLISTIASPPLPDEEGGGARRSRTDDILLAKQALYQLSYGPISSRRRSTLVGLDRLELSTLRLSGVRSNHLSYRPSRSSVCRQALKTHKSMPQALLGLRCMTTLPEPYALRDDHVIGKRDEDGGIPHLYFK